MHRHTRPLLVALALLAAGPAAAQYSPPGNPPPYYPPPPPAGRPPPPPQYAPQYAPRYDNVPNNVVRGQFGVAFATDGYACGYYGYYGYYSCGYGYGATWPNVNLEMDFGVAPYLALTGGANVMWGSYNGIHNTVWEPHLDLTLKSSPLNDVRGRLRIGLGIYLSEASWGPYGPGSSGMYGSSGSGSGAALRLGAGVSFLNRSVVGIGLDAVFEAGSIDGYYVSTFQLLIGPELHF